MWTYGHLVCISPAIHPSATWYIWVQFKDTCVCRRGWWGWRSKGRCRSCQRCPEGHSCNAGSMSRKPSCTAEAETTNDTLQCTSHRSLFCQGEKSVPYFCFPQRIPQQPQQQGKSSSWKEVKASQAWRWWPSIGKELTGLKPNWGPQLV